MLRKLIKEIEEHTKQPFDIKIKRHFFHLNAKIERLHANELRILNLITKAVESKEYENDIYCTDTHYKRKRFND